MCFYLTGVTFLYDAGGRALQLPAPTAARRPPGCSRPRPKCALSAFASRGQYGERGRVSETSAYVSTGTRNTKCHPLRLGRDGRVLRLRGRSGHAAYLERAGLHQRCPSPPAICRLVGTKSRFYRRIAHSFCGPSRTKLLQDKRDVAKARAQKRRFKWEAQLIPPARTAGSSLLFPRLINGVKTGLQI